MKKITTYTLLLFTLFAFSGCVNKHGISLKYYSDCKEYYDMQGFYHKECGKDDLVTYDEMKQLIKKEKPQTKENVW